MINEGDRGEDTFSSIGDAVVVGFGSVGDLGGGG